MTGPLVRSSAAVSLPASASRSARTTRIPRASRCSAISFPIPRAPPVTNATGLSESSCTEASPPPDGWADHRRWSHPALAQLEPGGRIGGLVHASGSHPPTFVGSAVRTFHSAECHLGAWSAQRIYQKHSHNLCTVALDVSLVPLPTALETAWHLFTPSLPSKSVSGYRSFPCRCGHCLLPCEVTVACAVIGAVPQ